MGLMFCFILFALSFGILSYSTDSYEMKLWVLLLGVFIPFILLSSNSKGEGAESGNIHSEELKLRPGPGFWLLIFGAGGFLRFFKLPTFNPWPSSDEALQGYFAIDLVKSWNWNIFYTSGQHPPLLIWLESLLFRFTDQSFLNLWFWPALFSFFTLLIGYSAARTFFSKSLSFIFTLLLAFSFWPLLFGRFGVQGTLVPFFEFVGIYLLGRFLKTKNPSGKNSLGVLLGLVLGFGSLTFTGWISVVVAFTGIVFYHLMGSPKKNFKSLTFFSLALLISYLPWVYGVVTEGFGGYLVGVSIFSGFFSGTQQMFTLFSNLTSLFWGSLQTGAAYGPTWGGILNPLLGGLFLIGLSVFYQARRQPFSKGLFFAFVVFLLPGFLAADHVEMFRIIPVMPILLLAAAVGAQKLAVNFTGGTRGPLLAVLFILSSSLDIYHLLRPQLDFNGFRAGFKTQVEDESFKAFKEFEATARERGPGIIFTEFLLLPHGHNLKVASYPFNAADNPRLNPTSSHWAGLVVNLNYVSFLAKRFPESNWKSLAVGRPEDGGLALGIIPLTPQNRELFLGWIKINDYLHALGVRSENMMNNPKLYDSVLTRLPGGYALMGGDPFLESLYGEWAAQYHYSKGLGENTAALQRALAKGYPSPHLYFKLGNIYYLEGDMKNAREAYRNAVKTLPNFTAAQAVLNYMDNPHKTTARETNQVPQRGRP